MPTKKEETKTEEKAEKKTAAKKTTAKKTAEKKTAAKKTTAKKTTAKKATEKKAETKAEESKTKAKSTAAKAKAAKSKKPEALYYGTGRRKNAVARVRLYAGKGEISVNGRDVNEYFNRQVLINDIKSPLNLTETQDHFDIVANIKGGGTTGQAGALRLGISRALLQAGDYREKLKSAGFLTRDSRMVERKKYGLKKARKRSQFSKR